MTNKIPHGHVSRRTMIAGMATLPFSFAVARHLFAADSSTSSDLILRENEPRNLEFDFAALQPITPNGKFYVRNHFAAPTVDSQSWALKVEGAVKNALRLSYGELQQLPSVTRTVTLECAGNGRIYLAPKADGVQWQLGAVSTAEWTGVPLSAILERAGVDPNTVEIVLEGADSGEPSKPSKPAGPIAFSRSIPLEAAQKGNVLLAYKMNGQLLPPSHGFPLRAIVPGWYGMASIKWLSRIVAVTEPYRGFFQTVDYAYWKNEAGFAQRVPITQMQVKSQIARPTLAEVIGKGSTFRIFGAAWSGDAAIAKVEVSTDGGKTYSAARLLGNAIENAWRLWEFKWTVPTTSGKYKLMSRATDVAGNSQPLERDKNRENYMINHVVPVEVQVQ